MTCIVLEIELYLTNVGDGLISYMTIYILFASERILYHEGDYIFNQIRANGKWMYSLEYHLPSSHWGFSVIGVSTSPQKMFHHSFMHF